MRASARISARLKFLTVRSLSELAGELDGVRAMVLRLLRPGELARELGGVRAMVLRLRRPGELARELGGGRAMVLRLLRPGEPAGELDGDGGEGGALPDTAFSGQLCPKSPGRIAERSRFRAPPSVPALYRFGGVICSRAFCAASNASCISL